MPLKESPKTLPILAFGEMATRKSHVLTPILWLRTRPVSLSQYDRLTSLVGNKMHYEKSLQIEQRLSDLLELIQSGQYSTPELAERVGVSVPTVSRSIQALRERGHEIVAENECQQVPGTEGP